jgi:DNA-binding NarL/FixJ family response regulator
VRLVGPQLVQVRPKRQEVEVVLAGEQPTKDALTPGLAGKDVRVVGQTTPEQTFALAASAARDVGVVIVDADAYGLNFVTDLRTVFPSVRLIVISRSPATRLRAIRAGAVLALPRSISATQLAKAITTVSSR